MTNEEIQQLLKQESWEIISELPKEFQTDFHTWRQLEDRLRQRLYKLVTRVRNEDW